MKRSPLTRRAPMRSKPKRSPLEFSEDVRSQARRLASDRCEAGLPGCAGGIHHFHHRKLRTHGGTGTLENCAALCGRCHAVIHANPDWAYRHGWMVKSFDDPARIDRSYGCVDMACEANHVASGH